MDKAVDENRNIPLVSVIVPIYNEEEAVGKVLKKLTLLEKKMPIEIIAVDDGSTDKTREVVRTFPSAILVSHPRNIGKGKAIVTGLSKSRGQIVVIQDADGEYMPEEIPKIIMPLVEKQADVVFGSRFMGNHDSMSVSHKLGNKILSLTASLLYNLKVTDIMSGHKAFSRKAIDSIEISANGFEIEVEMTGNLLRQRWRLKEVPIRYMRRQHGKSKIEYRDGFICLFKLFSSRFL